jgi:acyl-homoserine lactone acylase PvdQ
MRRAGKVSLALATEEKKRQINALMEAYRAGVNFYIRSLW